MHTVFQRRIAVATAVAASLLAGCGSEAPAPQKSLASAPGVEGPVEPAQAGARRSGAQAENKPPRIRSLEFEPDDPTSGKDVRVLVEVEDPDGDNVWLDYAWTLDGKPVEGSTPRVSLRGLPRGSRVEIEVSARDGKGGFDTTSLDTEVHNAAPVLGSVHVHASELLTSGETIVIRPEATDADGDALSFRYAWKVNGVRQNHELDSFDTSRLGRGDTVQAIVYASDGKSESEGRELPPLTVGNSPPRILSQPGEEFGNGDSFYQVRAEDPDGNGPLRYALESAPEGMRIDPRTGAIHWRPTPDQSGVHALAVIVSDTQGGNSRQAIEVRVGNAATSGSPAARQR